MRGARNVPYPADSAPFPENGATGSEGAAPPPPRGSRVPSVDSVTMGDYDPLTGRVVTEDGERMTIGSTHRADQVLGADSWRWLLLGPLSR